MSDTKTAMAAKWIEVWADKKLGKGKRPCGWPNFGSISVDEVAEMFQAYSAALSAAVREQFEKVLKSSDPGDTEYFVSPKVFINMLLARIRALPLLDAHPLEASGGQADRRDGPVLAGVEELAARFHDIYQQEAKRQGDVRHADAYTYLSENIKEFDRVLARYVLTEHDERIRLEARLKQLRLDNGKMCLLTQDFPNVRLLLRDAFNYDIAELEAALGRA